jgi:hypothetical protein
LRPTCIVHHSASITISGIGAPHIRIAAGKIKFRGRARP